MKDRIYQIIDHNGKVFHTTLDPAYAFIRKAALKKENSTDRFEVVSYELEGQE